MPLYLNQSAPRKIFKDLLGNANHLLITLLVGLHAVERGIVKECPPELRAAWNPESPEASAGRSRILLLGMALTRATDALDAYFIRARREPALFQGVELQNELDGAHRSVGRKLKIVLSHCDGVEPRIAALAAIMIAWRNRTVHSDDIDPIPRESWTLLEDNQDWLKNEFRGMEFRRLLTDFQAREEPTFKETASFIRATQSLVEQIDGILLSKLEARSFLKSFVRYALGEGKTGADAAAARKRIAQSIWGRDRADREARVRSFLMNNGLSQRRTLNVATEFDDLLIAEIAGHDPTQLLEYISP